MAARLMGRATAKRFAAGSAVAGIAVYATNLHRRADLLENPVNATEAEIQFNTSFGNFTNNNGEPMAVVPADWKGPVFQIKNDYPKAMATTADSEAAALPAPGTGVPIDANSEMPWMRVDFKKDPEKYCAVVKEYCYEGNVDNNFVVQKNQVRDWYHAPWMHWNDNGREPLNGLTFERSTPAYELSKTQPSVLQTWAKGFYNRAGASAFGQIWKDPNKPEWKPFKFPKGTAVFKILMTNASNQEVPSMAGAPSLDAVISVQPDTTQNVPDAGIRNKKASSVRLLQMDFAVQDDRAEIGWVFGTFMYDGSVKAKNPWDRIIPVGIMWGNDPKLTPEEYRKGRRPEESWISDRAEKLRISLGGSRPSFGFDGRLDGPADNFKSACASCHSTSQWKQRVAMVPDDDDPNLMNWFRNIPAGEPFTPGQISGDYSLQLMIGSANYKSWSNSNASIFKRTMLKIPFTEAAKNAQNVEEKRKALRDI